MGKNLFEIVKSGKIKTSAYEYADSGVTFDFRTLTMTELDGITKALAEKEKTLEKLQVTLDFGVVAGWKNLTIKALEKVSNLDISGYSPEEAAEEFPYIQEEASNTLLQMAEKNPDFGLFLLTSVTKAYKNLEEQKKT